MTFVTGSQSPRYALVTAAYNEERYLPNLLESVVAQRHRPVRWVIVSDGSTDGTDAIIESYASRYAFIVLRRITEDHPRNFMAQVDAINNGLALLKTEQYEFIGNLDADVTLHPDYFEGLLSRFRQNTRLGLAGGYICEWAGGTFQPRPTNSPLSVAHAIQLFRRECLEQIGGGYVRMPYGGPDWHAEVSARLHGWTVQSFPEFEVRHHRPTGAVAGLLNTCYREGLMDHSFGSHISFELFRVLRRIGQKPRVIGAAVRLWAYIVASLSGHRRPVSSAFVTFLREYEAVRLKRFLSLRADSE
jgi:poly-beta-1,6-N-acetyl-D-glucosamine synthase